ncbi:hypothetical protein ACWGDT_21390 [Streptomyces avermitilis]
MYRIDPRYAPAPQAVLHRGWQAVASQLPDGPAAVVIEGPRPSTGPSSVIASNTS